MDPHFLFNNLNVLSSLIEENPKKAEEFTQELSLVYRYVLVHQNDMLVSLKDEIDFAKNYLQLMEKRFEHGFTYKIKMNEREKELQLVPFSLQLLLENIFKHNIIDYQNPLTIEIYLSKGYLVVVNEGKKKTNKSFANTGFGLENIKQQYIHLIKKEISIENKPNSFEVRLPLKEVIIK